MRPRLSWWALYLEPILGVFALIVLLATLVVVNRIADTTENDFSVFLSSARWFREGADLYQRPLRSGPGYNLNTPATTLVFVPLSFLSDAVAFKVWTGLSIGGYLLAAFWIARATAPGRVISIAAALFLSQPVITSFLLGQVTAFMLLLMTAAWLADRRDRPFAAGVLLGAAIVIKPFLAVFLAYAAWRRSRALIAGLAAGMTAVAAIGLAVGGVAGYRSWLSALGQIAWTAHWLNASLLGLLTRTLTRTPEVLHMTPVVVRPDLVQPLWWAGATVVVAFAGRALVVTRDRDRAWCLMIASSLLLSPLGWVYYAPLMTGPLLALALRRRVHSRWMIAAGCACLLVPPSSLPVLGPTRTLLLGSISTWALLLFAGTLLVQTGDVPLETEGPGTRRRELA